MSCFRSAKSCFEEADDVDIMPVGVFFASKNGPQGRSNHILKQALSDSGTSFNSVAARVWSSAQTPNTTNTVDQPWCEPNLGTARLVSPVPTNRLAMAALCILAIRFLGVMSTVKASRDVSTNSQAIKKRTIAPSQLRPKR
jgi:hypothetical protein